jgi:hypothetical protein
MTAATSITVRVPLAIRHRPGRKTVVTPMAHGVAPVMTRTVPALVKALARAFRYQRMLDEERFASITEMAGAERRERGYLGSLVRLTLLAPDLIAAILDGRAAEVALPKLLEPFSGNGRNSAALWSSIERPSSVGSTDRSGREADLDGTHPLDSEATTMARVCMVPRTAGAYHGECP